MQQFTYTQKFNTALLTDQIRAAFPELIDPVSDAALLYSGNLFTIYPQEKGGIILQVPDSFTRIVEMQGLIATHDPTALSKQEQSRQKLMNLVQSCGGVQISKLTSTQIQALMAYLVYREGGLNLDTLTINPINQWL